MFEDPSMVELHEMLTPQGMRQRYLLGRYNFEKYSKAFGDETLIQGT